jgi:signal transduction histidine kinase
MYAWFVLLGALLSAPLWVFLTLWASRRTWRSARRLSARAKGQEQLAELGQLAGGLAHEIKNPLSTINLNLKLLSEDLQAPRDDSLPRCRRRLTSVQEEVDRLRDILEDFLRYAGRYELQLAPVDLRRLVEELADFFRPQAQAAHVLLRLNLPAEPVRCNVDQDLLKQALLNLMINATQAMTEGGELILNVSVQRDRALIEVIDTGPGMPPDVRQKVFDVYYSTRKGGSGLGLPTTRRIVRAHGGTVAVQSETGKGTRFLIALPLAG